MSGVFWEFIDYTHNCQGYFSDFLKMIYYYSFNICILIIINLPLIFAKKICIICFVYYFVLGIWYNIIYVYNGNLIPIYWTVYNVNYCTIIIKYILFMSCYF